MWHQKHEFDSKKIDALIGMKWYRTMWEVDTQMSRYWDDAVEREYFLVWCRHDNDIDDVERVAVDVNDWTKMLTHDNHRTWDDVCIL